MVLSSWCKSGTHYTACPLFSLVCHAYLDNINRWPGVCPYIYIPYATCLKTQLGLWVLYLPAEEAREACCKVRGGSQPGNERADWMTFRSLGR